MPPYCLLRSTALPLYYPPALFPVRCPHLYVRYVALCGVRLTNPTSFPSSLRSLALAASNAALHRHHPRTLSRLSTHRPAKPLVAVPPSHPTYRLSHYPAASNPLPLPSTRSLSLATPSLCPRRPLTARFALRDSALGSLLSFNCRLSVLSFSLSLSRLFPPSLPRPLSLSLSVALPPFRSSFLPCHCLATPDVTPSGRTSTPESRARCASERASE